MDKELPIPYTDFLYVNPVERKSALGTISLQTIGEVLAIGEEVTKTKVGDYVAFELWDKPEFQTLDGKSCHFIREKDVICKIPLSWIK